MKKQGMPEIDSCNAIYESTPRWLTTVEALKRLELVLIVNWCVIYIFVQVIFLRALFTLVAIIEPVVFLTVKNTRRALPVSMNSVALEGLELICFFLLSLDEQFVIIKNL